MQFRQVIFFGFPMDHTIKSTDYAVINPTTGEVVDRFDCHSEGEIQCRLEQASACFPEWSTVGFAHRADCFKKLSACLREKSEELAGTMALEMGKPLTQGRTEVEKCAFVCEYYATHAESFLHPYEVKTEMSESRVVYQALGSIFAIMPWNFPLWQVFRAAAPILMAGNTMILKHAPRVPNTANSILDLFDLAGFPDGALVNVFASNEQASRIIAERSVKGVCLTGSGAAGRAVASEAGRHLKPVLLELGGSDPYIVLEDADLELAAEKTVFSRMLNNGQTCISAKRFIVVDSVAAEFTDRVQAALEQQVMGDPLEAGVTQGPMAREDLCRNLHDQVERSIGSGARLICGGSLPKGAGFFYPATLLTGVKPGMAAFEEELFGPVGSIITVRSTEEAVALANQSSYGLGAAVFTRDIDLGRDLATSHIHAGTCVVNDFVRSDPRLPFGGINDSGFGRELGVEGIRQFVNIKTVAVGCK